MRTKSSNRTLLRTVNKLPVNTFFLLYGTLTVWSLLSSSLSSSSSSAYALNNNRLHAIAIANSRMLDPSFKFGARLTNNPTHQLKVNSRQSVNGESAAAIAFAADPQLKSDTRVNHRLRNTVGTPITNDKNSEPILSNNSPVDANKLKTNTTISTRALSTAKAKSVRSVKKNEVRTFADSSNVSTSLSNKANQAIRPNQLNSILKSNRKVNRKSFAANSQASAFAATGNSLAAQGHHRSTSVSLSQPVQNPKVSKRRRVPIKNDSQSPSAASSSSSSPSASLPPFSALTSSMSSPAALSAPLASSSTSSSSSSSSFNSAGSGTASRALNNVAGTQTASSPPNQPQNTPTSGAQSLSKDDKSSKATLLAYVWKGQISTFGRSTASSGVQYVRTVQHNGRTWLQSNLGQVQLPADESNARFGHVVELLASNNQLHVRPATSAEHQRLVSPRPKSNQAVRTNAQLNQNNANNQFTSPFGPSFFPDFSQLFGNSFPNFS